MLLKDAFKDGGVVGERRRDVDSLVVDSPRKYVFLLVSWRRLLKFEECPFGNLVIPGCMLSPNEK